jgi:hypothetical protein
MDGLPARGREEPGGGGCLEGVGGGAASESPPASRILETGPLGDRGDAAGLDGRRTDLGRELWLADQRIAPGE